MDDQLPIGIVAEAYSAAFLALVEVLMEVERGENWPSAEVAMACHRARRALDYAFIVGDRPPREAIYSLIRSGHANLNNVPSTFRHSPAWLGKQKISPSETSEKAKLLDDQDKTTFDYGD